MNRIIAFLLFLVVEVSAVAQANETGNADRIREQGDTIIYNVGSFAQQQDRSIGDVLKRMPGIDVANHGKIQYQGEDINKFYIEGSDLLGGTLGQDASAHAVSPAAASLRGKFASLGEARGRDKKGY